MCELNVSRDGLGCHMRPNGAYKTNKREPITDQFRYLQPSAVLQRRNCPQTKGNVGTSSSIGKTEALSSSLGIQRLKCREESILF